MYLTNYHELQVLRQIGTLHLKLVAIDDMSPFVKGTD